MTIIGLVPVLNEAWVLRDALACLSAFCDVVIVSDQQSDDDSREICRAFPKVVLLESSSRQICTVARWTLLDAARDYDGCNLLWCTDADELVSPPMARAAIERRADLVPGTVIECQYLHLWGGFDRYRVNSWKYGPHLKPLAVLDDRRLDYDRSRPQSIHEPRVPNQGARGTETFDELHVLHLQWLLERRMQMRQAWYRCHELMDGRAAATINENYALTLPDAGVRTAPLPAEWTEGLTFPDLAVDQQASWTERDVVSWLDERGVDYFEPLEIWHIPRLREEFVRRTGRQPRPDRSYRPRWPARAGSFARRIAAGARRRLPF
jgi:glycosyltransferase involved in cell wall biosynthesis